MGATESLRLLRSRRRYERTHWSRWQMCQGGRNSHSWWYHCCQNVADPSSSWVLGRTPRTSSHYSDEGVWQISLCAHTLDSGTTWFWCGRLASDEENDGFCWHYRLFHVLLRSHAYERKFHESNFRSFESNVRLSDARPLEAHALHEAAVPGAHRPPRADEDSLNGHVSDVH